MSGFPQGSSRLSQTAAGSHHVVDHDHGRTTCHAGDTEGALKIAGSLSGAEPRLIAYRTRLMQQPAGPDRRLPSEQPSGSSRQRPGRIETSLPDGGTRRRHRNQHHGARRAGREVQNALDGSRQPAGEEWGQVECSPLFVSSDELPQDRIVRCSADREGKADRARVRTGRKAAITQNGRAAPRADPPPGLRAAVASRTQQQLPGRRKRSLEIHRLSFPPLSYSVTSTDLFCGQTGQVAAPDVNLSVTKGCIGPPRVPETRAVRLQAPCAT